MEYERSKTGLRILKDVLDAFVKAMKTDSLLGPHTVGVCFTDRVEGFHDVRSHNILSLASNQHQIIT